MALFAAAPEDDIIASGTLSSHAYDDKPTQGQSISTQQQPHELTEEEGFFKNYSCVQMFELKQSSASFSIKQSIPQHSASLTVHVQKQAKYDHTLAHFNYTETAGDHPTYTATAKIFSRCFEGNRYFLLQKGSCDPELLFFYKKTEPAPDKNVTLEPHSTMAFSTKISTTASISTAKISVPIAAEDSFSIDVSPTSLRTLDIYLDLTSSHKLDFTAPTMTSATPYTQPLCLHPSAQSSAATSCFEEGQNKTYVCAYKKDNINTATLTIKNALEHRHMTITASEHATWNKPSVVLARCVYQVSSDTQKTAQSIMTIHGIIENAEGEKRYTVKAIGDGIECTIEQFIENTTEPLKTNTQVATRFLWNPVKDPLNTTGCFILLPHTRIHCMASSEGLSIKTDFGLTAHVLIYKGNDSGFKLETSLASTTRLKRMALAYGPHQEIKARAQQQVKSIKEGRLRSAEHADL